MYTFDGSIVSDLHKDTYGFRPTADFWANWNDSSDADKQHIWDHLCEAHDYAMDLEANRTIEAINAFEIEVANALDLGASSRDVAIRWIVESLNLTQFDLMYGGNYICFLKDLPLSMAQLFEKSIRQLSKNLMEELL